MQTKHKKQGRGLHARKHTRAREKLSLENLAPGEEQQTGRKQVENLGCVDPEVWDTKPVSGLRVPWLISTSNEACVIVVTVDSRGRG